MIITSAAGKGSRPYQEDRFNIIEDNTGVLVAVMDGHGGSETSEKISQLVPTLWPTITGLPKTRLKRLVRQLEKQTQDHSGSTFSAIFIPTDSKRVYVAILGDSPVLIKNAKGKINYSPEHNVRSNGYEYEAALSRGAFVSNGYMYQSYDGQGLQMSRALGDIDLAKVLDRTPEIYTESIGPNSWILVASDGLFDPAHQNSSQMDEIVALINDPLLNVGAPKLVQNAINKPTHDNVTAILIRV
jgi:serine/threonine protein phosphatase PrpC